MAPHAYLVKLLIALRGGQAQSPYWIQINEHDEGWHVEAPYSTWCPKAMAEEGHGGHRRILMMGSSRWCWPYVIVHGMVAWLVAALYVGLVAWVQGSVGLLWWWYDVQGIGLVGVGIMHGLVWVGWWQLLGVLHMDMLCGLWCRWEGLGQRAKASKTWWNYYVWAVGAWVEALWWCAK